LNYVGEYNGAGTVGFPRARDFPAFASTSDKLLIFGGGMYRIFLSFLLKRALIIAKLGHRHR